MCGDFSRLVPDDSVASRVLQQQGRVVLDSDWNEATAVLLQGQRTLAADLMGPHGAPRDRAGYEVSQRDHDDVPDLGIGEGIYYVDGIRVEVRRPLGAKFLLRSEQPYPPWVDAPGLPATPYLVYLDVWERHVCAVHDESIGEVALGGPDTFSRAEVVWQVTAAAATPDLLVECGDFPLWSWRQGLVGTPPRLRVWARRAGEDDDPILADPDAGYCGVENRLYRVEITDVDDEGARFVWSRENGSAVAAWTGVEGDKLLVEGPRDTVRGFSPGNWLELTWDELQLAGQPGPRVEVVGVDSGTITYDTSTTTAMVPGNPRQLTHPIARRWDTRPRTGLTLVGGAIDINESDDDRQAIPLEDGITIQFATPPGGGTPTRYRVGDYWTIPARAGTGDIIWPRDDSGEPMAVVPQGVEHHFAPLALVTHGGAVTDLRQVFDAMASCQ